MSNEGCSSAQNMGVRATGTTQGRLLDLQEAESGGSDAATLHVIVDSSSRVEWYSESGTTDRYFYPIGWWILP